MSQEHIDNFYSLPGENVHKQEPLSPAELAWWGGLGAFEEPHGTLPLRLGGEDWHITGGPYYAKPKAALGIKLAIEIDEECHIDLPIHDYTVPAQAAMEVCVIQTLTMLLEFGRDFDLYAGCMGGIGRTGLLFACLKKVEQELNRKWWHIGERPNPVFCVRDQYHDHAVETIEQMKFVAQFDAKAVAKFMKRYLTN